jgi:hypothetical protein
MAFWIEAIMPNSHSAQTAIPRFFIEEVIASEWRLLAGLVGSCRFGQQMPCDAPQILGNREHPIKMLLGN